MEALIVEGSASRVVRGAAEVREALAAGHRVWIDLSEQSADNDAVLTEVLKVHALTMEDLWAEAALPKAELFPEYLYVRVHGLATGPGQLRLLEVDLILSQQFVVTHDATRATVPGLWKDRERASRLLRKGTAWLAHAVLDHMTDRYIPVINDLDERIHALETDVLAKGGTPEGKALVHDLFACKRSVQALRRISVHQREVLLRLSRGDFPHIPRESAPFFRDVFDHFARVTDVAEAYRELIAGALQAYLSVQSNKTGDIVKTLTMISTTMLPLSFIAGLYGMNYEHMPELKWHLGYFAALTTMVVVGFTMVVWFRLRRWL
jgi:magnesium transporter